MNTSITYSENYLTRFATLFSLMIEIGKRERKLGEPVDFDTEPIREYIDLKHGGLPAEKAEVIEPQPFVSKGNKRGVKPSAVVLPEKEFTVKDSGISQSIVYRLLRENKIEICGEIRAKQGPAIKVYRKVD